MSKSVQSKLFLYINVAIMGASIFAIALTLGAEWVFAMLAGLGAATWWWLSTEIAMDLEAESVGEPTPWPESEETTEMPLPDEPETVVYEEVPVRQLEQKDSNAALALRADRAYTIDQLLRSVGYTSVSEKSNFWSDRYERQRRGKRHSIQTIHNLDGSVLTLTDWISDADKETSVVALNDPIDEEQIKKTLGPFV